MRPMRAGRRLDLPAPPAGGVRYDDVAPEVDVGHEEDTHTPGCAGSPASQWMATAIFGGASACRFAGRGQEQLAVDDANA